MQIQSDVSLKDFSTMRLGGLANALTTVKSKGELTQALSWAKERSLPVLILGDGSNVIFSDGYAGLVIVCHIPGFEVVKDTKTATHIRIGAGEVWDSAVERTVDMGLHGIEYLSAIPGRTGATPVQNVGAYGMQISRVLTELEAYDMTSGAFVTLKNEDCQFGYRTSLFKPVKGRRYIITSVTLRLTKDLPQPPFYDSLQAYLDEHDINIFTPQTIRNAVKAIRAVKLPDPSRMANSGSFFKNPVVPAHVGKQLVVKFPQMQHWHLPDGTVKLAAGWLVEHAGLRGYSAHGMRTYEHHALVLVNDSAKDYADLTAFRQEIIQKVHGLFGVILEQEPELL